MLARRVLRVRRFVPRKTGRVSYSMRARRECIMLTSRMSVAAVLSQYRSGTPSLYS